MRLKTKTVLSLFCFKCTLSPSFPNSLYIFTNRNCNVLKYGWEMVDLNKIILIILLLIDIFYFGYYVLHIESTMLLNGFWTFIFIVGIIWSSIFWFRLKNKSGYTQYLSIAVLVTSVSSLGAFGFRHLLSNLFL